MLTEKFAANNYIVRHIENDSDILIVETMLKEPLTYTKVVIGKNVIILPDHTQQ